MSYRDWERGEGSPRERQPIAPWDDRDQPVPADPYSSVTDRHRTPSRRRAIERGHGEPVDAYLPRWAVESGIAHADGRGRHAAPDDDEDDDRPVSGGGRRAERRRRESGRAEVRAIGAAPGSEHTREWTFDRPQQEQGYVGSRRADSDEDDPVSAPAPTSRPRRSASRRPQVIWSGGDESDLSAADPEPERPTRRGRRAAADSGSRPAVDPWRRAVEPEPEPQYRPAVDPWDASGVHSWQSPEPDGRWERSGAGSRWQQGDDTAQWDRFTDTAQWDRTDVGQWDTGVTADRWDRTDGGGDWGRPERPRSVEPASGEAWPWSEQPEGFWSGTRLAGDDPRWMDPPPSAPRSPVVAYTAPRPRMAPRRRAEPSVASRALPASSLRQRIDSVGGGTWHRRLEDDLLDPDPGGPLRPVVYTAACYLVPAALVFLWLLTLSGQAPAGCVTDISGGGCDSPRAHAFASLVAGAPRFGLALVSSLVVAVLLRRVGTTWRSATVALAAAVVGGGLSTVMISAVTGQPIG
ncbi:hypothetical protein [Micromonospora psammae]|uniref:hypothetical protein n=1 Tax=Micromonospora sp. CPCC 205556 TaxID=3122398 RepID=UPI002FEFA2DE